MVSVPWWAIVPMLLLDIAGLGLIACSVVLGVLAVRAHHETRAASDKEQQP